MDQLIIGRLAGGNIELGASGIHVEFEGIELLADALQCLGALEALLIPCLEVLGILLFLFLRLLRSNDPLVSERGLQPFELRSSHVCGVDEPPLAKDC